MGLLWDIIFRAGLIPSLCDCQLKSFRKELGGRVLEVENPSRGVYSGLRGRVNDKGSHRQNPAAPNNTVKGSYAVCEIVDLVITQYAQHVSPRQHAEGAIVWR